MLDVRNKAMQSGLTAWIRCCSAESALILQPFEQGLAGKGMHWHGCDTQAGSSYGVEHVAIRTWRGRVAFLVAQLWMNLYSVRWCRNSESPSLAG